MPPTESQILSHFLLPPSPLPAVISLSKFTELFPASQRQNPQILALYRELQHQRAVDVDDVKTSITNEAKKGNRQKREVARVRRRKEGDEAEGLDDADMRMEVELYGPASLALSSRPHTIQSVRENLHQACEDIEAEIAVLEEQSAHILDDIKATIGDLSDLRYGRLQRMSDVSGDLATEVVEGLGRLETLSAQRHGRTGG